MTLQDFFDACANNPSIILFYFIAVPLTALLAGIFGKGEGHTSPWKYLYSTLVYLASVPGIFGITLSVYLFLFERQSIMDTNLYTQIIPVLSMIITLFIIKNNVDLEKIPGFGKLSALLVIIAIVLSLMWILDKTHIFAITVIPFMYVVIMLVLLFVGIWFAWKQMAK